MEANNMEQRNGVLKIYNYLFRLTDSMNLKCMIELGIPDAIHRHGGPISLLDLLNTLGLPPTKSSHLQRLMRLLTRSGFFTFDTTQKAYSLTSLSSLLLTSASPGTPTMAPYILCILNHHHFLSLDAMSRWFRSEQPTAFALTHNNCSLWEYCGQDDEYKRSVNHGLSKETELVMNAFLSECSSDGNGVLEGVNSIVDVGGGLGMAAQAISEAFPHMKCAVLDLPHTIEDAQKSALAAAKVAYIAGDMFEHIPPADAIILKCVLHDWTDEDCVKILKKAKIAITSNDREKGKVIIIECVIDMNTMPSDIKTETQLFFDMCMMVSVEGKERTEDEWKKIFNEAGFSTYKIRPVLELRSIIELYP